MADCECLTSCIFFNDKMANMPSTAENIKHTYCRREYDKCARHMVFRALGRPKVPDDLFPNQIEKAQEIIFTK